MLLGLTWQGLMLSDVEACSVGWLGCSMLQRLEVELDCSVGEMRRDSWVERLSTR